MKYLFVAIVLAAVVAGFYFFTRPPSGSEAAVRSQVLPTDRLSATIMPTRMPTVTSAPAVAMSPTPVLDTAKSYQATLTTDQGQIVIELNSGQTPVTVNNFINLARQKFYDGTVFHRTINGFMIQGGDPKGDGTGGPGYKFDDEPFEGSYTRGTVAMANSGPNTNGSQFFIMHQDNPLPKNYVIFGKVVNGLEVVDKIATAAVTTNPLTGERSVPVRPVVLTSVTISSK